MRMMQRLQTKSTDEWDDKEFPSDDERKKLQYIFDITSFENNTDDLRFIDTHRTIEDILQWRTIRSSVQGCTT